MDADMRRINADMRILKNSNQNLLAHLEKTERFFRWNTIAAMMRDDYERERREEVRQRETKQKRQAEEQARQQEEERARKRLWKRSDSSRSANSSGHGSWSGYRVS